MEVLCVSFVVPFVRRRMFIPLHTFVRNLAMQRVKKGAMRSAPIGLRGRLRLSVCLSVCPTTASGVSVKAAAIAHRLEIGEGRSVAVN